MVWEPKRMASNLNVWRWFRHCAVWFWSSFFLSVFYFLLWQLYSLHVCTNKYDFLGSKNTHNSHNRITIPCISRPVSRHFDDILSLENQSSDSIYANIINTDNDGYWITIWWARKTVRFYASCWNAFRTFTTQFQLQDVSASIMSCFINFTVCIHRCCHKCLLHAVSMRSPAAHFCLMQIDCDVLIACFLEFCNIFTAAHFIQVEWWIHLSYHDFRMCVFFHYFHGCFLWKSIDMRVKHARRMMDENFKYLNIIWCDVFVHCKHYN